MARGCCTHVFLVCINICEAEGCKNLGGNFSQKLHRVYVSCRFYRIDTRLSSSCIKHAVSKNCIESVNIRRKTLRVNLIFRLKKILYSCGILLLFEGSEKQIPVEKNVLSL